MSKSGWCARAVALMALGCAASVASASGQRTIFTFNVISVVGESGYTGAQNLVSYPLTSTPYDFTNQFGPQPLARIDALSLTLTILDGDTAPGDFDFNNLYLALDGINTGLALNGFPDNQILTLTLDQISPATSSALLAALLPDKQWAGTVLDLSPNNAPAGDTIAFPSRIDTTLVATITTAAPPPPLVPLPAAAVLGVPMAALAGVFARWWRRAG